MRIAFYAPMKSPRHPVPSGDRLMARLLMTALEAMGADVELVSELRSFTRAPSAAGLRQLEHAAASERDRIARHWAETGKPDLWFTYHPYYKSPDLLGPDLAREASIPYVTAEASYAAKRDHCEWAAMQAPVAKAIIQAAVNICMTARDREGIAATFPQTRIAMLAPFIEAERWTVAGDREPGRLISVAMMRPGDKLDSYAALAKSLERVSGWTLSIVGDGPCRAEVEALFSGFDPGRITWHGECAPAEIAALLGRACLYVWPGCGEAYGLSYLEAQAAGLPVVAQAIAGVPEVVVEGRTGLLTPAGDVNAYGAAIQALLADAPRRLAMGAAARDFVLQERSMRAASLRLAEILRNHALLEVK